MTEKRKPPAGYGWKPGQSGNPKGRKPGTSEVQKLRAAIAGKVPDILNALLAQALEGDVSAARLLLERAILAAVASAELAPSQGAALLGALGTLARVAEVDELAARVAALESKHGNP